MKRKPSHLYPAPIQPSSHQEPMQINALSTLSTSSSYKGSEKGVETLNRGVAGFQKTGGEADRSIGPASLGEPDARGVSHLVGEHHPRAKLSDAECELIRLEYEAGIEGSGPRIGYRALAKKWNTSKITIRDIVNMRRRNARPERWVVTRRRRRKPVL